MSGGYFNYDQWRLENMADQLDRLIENNDDETLNDYGCTRGRGYSPETIARFRETRAALMRAAKMAHRVDWTERSVSISSSSTTETSNRSRTNGRIHNAIL